MWLSVGIGELGVVAVLALTTAVLAALRLQVWRWATVGLACAIVATICSPADPISTVLLGAVFLLFFVGGLRVGGRRSVAAT